MEKRKFKYIEKLPFEYGKEVASKYFEKFRSYYDNDLGWEENSGLFRKPLPAYPGIDPEIFNDFILNFRYNVKKQNTLEKISAINAGKRSFKFINDFKPEIYDDHWFGGILFESIKMGEDRKLFKTDIGILFPEKIAKWRDIYYKVIDKSDSHGLKIKSDFPLDNSEIDFIWKMLYDSVNQNNN